MDTEWVKVPKRLTFGMRVALEVAVERHADDADRMWSEVLDYAPAICAPHGRLSEDARRIGAFNDYSGTPAARALEKAANTIDALEDGLKRIKDMDPDFWGKQGTFTARRIAQTTLQALHDPR